MMCGDLQVSEIILAGFLPRGAGEIRTVLGGNRLSSFSEDAVSPCCCFFSEHDKMLKKTIQKQKTLYKAAMILFNSVLLRFLNE
jgi:hypothetical protein